MTSIANSNLISNAENIVQLEQNPRKSNMSLRGKLSFQKLMFSCSDSVVVGTSGS